jgi:recombination associated protein RdgC
MFKNALVHRIEHCDEAALADIESRLRGALFVECGATQPESVGWVEPRGEKHGALAESVGGQLILKLCSETRTVPGSVVKGLLDERLDKIKRDTGRRPRGKPARELKDEIVHELLPRAFPRRSTTWVWLDLQARLVLIGSASAKMADGVVTRLIQLLGGGLRLVPLQTRLAPATAMAAWLSEKQAPAGFSIDRECVLEQPDSGKAAVRYARHMLDIDEVGAHIRQGKLPTQLALTWNSRVSFVLTETLALKRIKLLDVAIEGATPAAGDAAPGENAFDADVAISTGELKRLLPDLIDALGGVLEAAAEAPAALRP